MANKQYVVPQGSAPGGSNISTPVSVANGGTGDSTLTAHGVLMGNGTSAVAASVAGNSGAPFLSGGASANGAYGSLNLAGGSTVVTGVLPPANGGGFLVSSAPQGYLLPFGAIGATAAADTGTGAANSAVIFPFQLDGTVIFTKGTVYIDTTSNGNHEYIGIYRLSDLSLVAQLTFTLPVGTGPLASASITQTTLVPDTYLLAWSQDQGTSVMIGVTINSKARQTLTLSANLSASKASVLSGGLFPGTLPALSGWAAGTNVVPIVYLEP